MKNVGKEQVRVLKQAMAVTARAFKETSVKGALESISGEAGNRRSIFHI